MISRGWVQAVIIVVLFGFLVLGLLAWQTYTGEPPIPARTTDEAGNLLFTRDDVIAGQEVFLRNGLMEYGSIFGHGAYLGPDYTADYSSRRAYRLSMHYGGAASDQRAGEDHRGLQDQPLRSGDRRRSQYSAAQAAAFEKLAARTMRSIFAEPTHAIRPAAHRRSRDPEQIQQLTAFFSWSAWTAAALRPGQDLLLHQQLASGTAGRQPCRPPTALVWSVLSLIALLGGIGLLFAAFGRWNFLGWHGREQPAVSFPLPDEVALTPAQRATRLVLLRHGRAVLDPDPGRGRTQHYRADLGGLLRDRPGATVPLQPRAHLARPARDLLGSHVVSGRRDFPGPDDTPAASRAARTGSPTRCWPPWRSSCSGVCRRMRRHPRLVQRSSWPGSGQGFEYLDLGRFWQILLTIGLLLLGGDSLSWHARPPRNASTREHALAVLLLRALDPGLLRRRPAGDPDSHFTTTDFWRFWVVHLWVEDFLELFTTIMVAYIFVLLGVVARTGGADGDLSGHPALLGRRGGRHDAPRLFLGRARRSTWRSGRFSRPAR